MASDCTGRGGVTYESLCQAYDDAQCPYVALAVWVRCDANDGDDDVKVGSVMLIIG